MVRSGPRLPAQPLCVPFLLMLNTVSSLPRKGYLRTFNSVVYLPLEQGRANFFRRGPDRKYFWLVGQQVTVSDSATQLWRRSVKAATDDVQWTRLCPWATQNGLRAGAPCANSRCQWLTIPSPTLTDSVQMLFSHWNFSWLRYICLLNVLAPQSIFLFQRTDDHYCI